MRARTLCILFLALAFVPVAGAQDIPSAHPPVDSFFDIFTEINLGDPKCDPCEMLERMIAEKQAEIDAIEGELDEINQDLSALDAGIEGAEQSLGNSRKQLEEMRNPKNYVESEGRRYDSRDHAERQRWFGNQWRAYKEGNLTAEEYSNRIGKSFDDPEIREELERLGEEIERELEQEIEDAENALEEMREEKEDLEEEKADLEEKLGQAQQELGELQSELEDCLKRCPNEEVNIPEDYGIGQEEKNVWDRLNDLWSGLFGGGEEESGYPLAGLGDFLDGLGGDMPVGDGTLDLPPFTPPAESFFDIFADIELPPVICHLCDPIRAQLEEIQESLNDLLDRQVELNAAVEEAYDDLAQAQRAKDAAQRALDEINDPRSYAESEGRRMDSSDQAAMRVRNGRLWDAYRSGDLSAQDLENEWKKPFDDPEVQDELDGIKQRMKDEFRDAINDAQEAIDRLNEEITRNNEELVDLAGAIAAHRAVIDYLLRDLSECEKRCREHADEPVDLVLPGFEGFLFPDNFEGWLEGGDGTGADGSDDEQGDDDEGDEQNDEDDDDDDEDDREDGDDAEDGDEDKEEGDDREKKVGILCDWFGLFCPKKEEVPDLTIGYALDCFEGKMDASLCAPLDSNQDGTVNATDLNDWDLSLAGPSGLNIPLTINGMDGDDTLLTPNDLNLFGGCLNGGPCDGFNFTPSPLLGGDVPFDSFSGLNGGDFGLLLNGPGGNDVLLGSVPDPFVGMDGISGFDPNLPPPPVPDGFFGPGPDPFGGGLTLFGPNGEIITPPPPPPPPAQSEQQIVERLVRETLARLPRLKECEKYVVTVTRQRIGNRTRYTVRVVRTRDDVKCPRCPAGTFDDFTACNNSCMNTNGCQRTPSTLFTERGCYVCPPGSGEEGDSGLLIPGTGVTDGEDQRCGSDADCDDADECTQDTCNALGECTHADIKDCTEGGGECPDIAHESRAACLNACTRGECVSEPFNGRDCWFCADRSLDCPAGKFSEDKCSLVCPSSEGVCTRDVQSGCFTCKKRTVTGLQCPSSSMDISTCEKTCEEPEKGKCEKSSTRDDGVSCYTCRTATQVSEQCPSGSSANCSGSCDGRCELVKTLGNGTKCEKCVTSTTVSCPQGHARTESECPSDSRAVPDNSGCFECVVTNCPSGTYKNECPSSCGGGCDIATQEGDTKCYRCKKSCEDLCGGQNYGKVGKDWSDYIQSYLNGYTCVSGASISIQTATVGDCSCSNQPTITIDTRVPVCAGTPCGDVACGQSTSCPVGENTTATVSCKWGGWKKIDMNKFQPVVGQ